MRKRQAWLGWAVMTAFVISGVSAQAQTTNYSILHSFVDIANDGWNPQGQPVLVGNTLFAPTYFGGALSNGAVFKVDTAGSGFGIVYSFDGSTNGANPTGSLILNPLDGALYGMTVNAGTNGAGVVFRLTTDGSSYQVVHSFGGGTDDGAYPYGSLVAGGSTLYGMTTGGGSNSLGAVFSMDVSGSSFTLLHSFEGPPNDGYVPWEGVTLSGSTLYGTTLIGGTNEMGIVFSVGTDGNGYAIQHQFVGGTNDGAYPAGQLTLNGSTLFGITSQGGTNDAGTVFSINTDGTGYTLLHHFVGGTNDGAFPQFGSLVIAPDPVTSNTVICGATVSGGRDQRGLIYQMNLDGSGFTIVHSFSTNRVDGAFPFYGPIVANNALYGITDGGGPTNAGVIYSMSFSFVETNVITDLRITDIRIITNDVLITWTTTGIFPQTDFVQVNRGDTNGGYTSDFIDLSPDYVLPAGTTTTNYLDVGGATNFPSRYYRVRAVP
jgi:uncharacterized repeat protein (TIGR03803 family)